MSAVSPEVFVGSIQWIDIFQTDINVRVFESQKEKCQKLTFIGTTARHWGSTLKWTSLYLIFPLKGSY